MSTNSSPLSPCPPILHQPLYQHPLSTEALSIISDVYLGLIFHLPISPPGCERSGGVKKKIHLTFLLLKRIKALIQLALPTPSLAFQKQAVHQKFERTIKTNFKNFPGSPVVKTSRFCCRGCGFDHWLGIRIPHAVQCCQIKTSEALQHLPITQNLYQLGKNLNGTQQWAGPFLNGGRRKSETAINICLGWKMCWMNIGIGRFGTGHHLTFPFSQSNHTISQLKNSH